MLDSWSSYNILNQIIMSMTEASPHRHVAVLAFPFGCHAQPVLNLVMRLARVTPRTKFSFLNTAKSNGSLFHASKPDLLPNNIKTYDVEDVIPKDYVPSGNPLEAVDLFLMAAPENFRKCLCRAVEETGSRISCLVTDGFFMPFAAKFAEDMNVPWIPVWIPLPCTLLAHIHTDLIRELKSNPVKSECRNIDSASKGFEDMTLGFIPGLCNMRVKDSPEEVLFDDSILSKMLHQIGKLLPQATAVVMNSYEELFPTSLVNELKLKSPAMFYVGALTLTPSLLPSFDDDTESAMGCLSWLDGQRPKSVAYISFGTVATLPHDELVALTEALEMSGVSFLWSIRGNSKDHLPTGFLERTRMKGIIVNWAPQVQVLAHEAIGVFVTHCGCNSVYESIANGVPMICRPFFGDHRMTARMVERVWGIGVGVEGEIFTKDELVKSLELILNDQQGETMRHKAQSLKDVVHKATGPGGRAMRYLQALTQLIS